WIMKHFIDPEVEFFFVEPFNRIKFGSAFDTPEAEIRRHGLQSASEFLITQRKLSGAPKLAALAHMTNLTEVTPWALASDPAAARLADRVRRISTEACGKSLRASCLNNLLVEMDKWYQGRSDE